MVVSPRTRDYNPILFAILVITLGAIVLRVAFLGARIAHWDEARVGYDILRYVATGAWEYRPIVHGPFLPQINRFLFAALGASDFTARLIVAIIGGCLPLATWLYRDHLSDVELIALALFFTMDPILLYYSRFMRNDVVLATFIFVSFGFFLRAHTTHKPRYLYAATVFLALAFTTKGNAILYVVTIGVGLLLLFDHRLFLARDTPETWKILGKRYTRSITNTLWAWRLHLVLCTLVFFVIIVVFYAPRGGAVDGLDLRTALTTPTLLPAVIREATIGSADKLVSLWLFGTMQDHAYLPFIGFYLRALGTASGALVFLAVFGFLTDRYYGEKPRDIVSLGFYWGLLSIIGYPIAMDIQAAWSVTHAVLPLAIPAAAGVGRIYSWGVDARRANDQIGVVLAVGVFLLVFGQMAGTAVITSYSNPQDPGNVLVQYAQPAGEMRPALDAIDRAVTANPTTDVVWYGDHFYLADESVTDRLPVANGNWYNRLPLPWYFELSNATVESERTISSFEPRLAAEAPPVVITCTGGDQCPSDTELETLGQTLDGYAQYQYLARQTGLTYVVFIDDTYAPSPQAGTD